MKPAYDQLAGEYDGHAKVTIMDVDCTVERDLCQTEGIRGYPTIKYWVGGEPAEGSKYNSGRDYEAMKKFVTDTLE